MSPVSAETRIAERGLVLPPEPKLPAGVAIPFQWVRVVDDRCLISGHGALDADGAPAGPFGRVPSEVALEAAQGSAHSAALAALAAIRRSIGSLDRIAAWLVVNGFVNADDGYPHTTAVLNPVSELIVDLFGPEVGAHARTAIGVRALPMNLPVVFSAEVLLA
jgi:enamine deaminase RidA (YjgF/YER057c/UK114 family)